MSKSKIGAHTGPNIFYFGYVHLLTEVRKFSK